MGTSVMVADERERCGYAHGCATEIGAEDEELTGGKEMTKRMAMGIVHPAGNLWAKSEKRGKWRSGGEEGRMNVGRASEF